MMQDGTPMDTACGSPDYVAPEIVQNQEYDGSLVDAWSSGVILYTMLFGRLPFDEPNKSRMFKRIIRADYKIDQKILDSNVSSHALDLLSKLLCADPRQRLTPRAALQHPWFTSVSHLFSHLVDFDKFLVHQGINLKPKKKCHLDPDVM